MNKLRGVKSILQTTPKGSYYEGSEEQLNELKEKFEELLEEDRSLFSVSALLPSTDYAKGVISHYLLNESIGEDTVDYPLMYNWNSNIEDRIILYTLRNMGYARAIKNLLMLAGREDGIDFDRVNNTRARKIIMNYVFGRDDDSLEYLSVKFSKKLSKLLKHALGYRDLMCIIEKKKNWRRPFNKYFTSIDNNSDEFFEYRRVVTVLGFLYNENVNIDVLYHFERFELYNELKELAKQDKDDEFKELISENPNKIPTEVIEGWIGGFQLDVDLNEAMKHGNMTDSQKMNRQRTSERKETKSESTKREKDVDLDVDYKNQSLYDLIKMMFARYENDEDISDELMESMEYRIEEEKLDVELGDTVVTILDKSDSMKGSDERHLHPFINGLATSYTLESDMVIETGDSEELYPSGNTNLASSLLQAVKKESEVDTVVVISDGYENTIKGMFERVYNKLRDMGYEFDVVHINPIQTSDIDSIKLADGIEPINIEDNRMLETHFALSMLESNPEVARNLFLDKMREKLGEGLSYGKLKGKTQ